MAQEVGVAYVALLPSAKGFSKALEGQVGAAAGSGEKKLSGFLSKVTKGAAATVAGVVATVGGITLGKGISRALNIEDAQAKLKGLGHDAKSIEAIMTDALNSVKGTAFGLDTAATVAATAVAAGIKPGKELEKYLRLAGDAATIAGSSMEEMGSIFNKVESSGKAYNDTLQQMAEKGIPIYQWLADELGTTTDAVFKLASEGKVSSEMFRDAIEKNIAGAALESGNTTRGAFANMMAAMGRFGAKLAGPFLNTAKQFFNEMIVVFDGLGESMQPAFDALNDWASGISFDGLGQRILDKITPVVSVISDGIAAAFNGNFSEWFSSTADDVPFLGTLRDVLTALQPLAPVVKELAPALADAARDLAPQLVDAAKDLIPLIPPLVEVLKEVLELALDILPDLTETVSQILGGISDLLQSEEAQGFLDWLSDVLIGIVDLLGTRTTDVLQELSNFWRDLGVGPMADFVQGLSDAFDASTTFEILGNLKDMVSNFFADLWAPVDEAGARVRDGLDRIGGYFSAAFYGIQSVVAGAVLIIHGLLTGNMSEVENVVSTTFSRVGDLLSGVWERIVSVAQGLGDQLRSAVASAFEMARSAAADGAQQVVSAVVHLPETIRMMFVGAGAWLRDSGRALIRGFIDGINDMTSGVGDAISGVLEWAQGFFPHSPALRGPFSGAGWDMVADGGKSLMEQFVAGADISPDLQLNGIAEQFLTLNAQTPAVADRSQSVQVVVNPAEGMDETMIGISAAREVAKALGGT